MKSKSSVSRLLIVVIGVLALPNWLAAQHRHYKLIDLGTFGGPNSFVDGGAPSMINNRGAVAGEAETSIPCPYAGAAFSDGVFSPAFVWRNGVLTNLGLLPGGCFTLPNSINSRGMMVGSGDIGVIDDMTGFPVLHADFRYRGRVLDLGTFGGSFSLASQVNDRGQVVGGAENTDPDPWNFGGILELPSPTAWHAFLWQSGKKRDLGTLGGPDSFAFSINQNGQAAGFSFTNSVPNPATGIPTVDPFLWDRGQMIDLGSLGGTVGLAGSVNNRGQVAGASDTAGDQATHGFLWQNGVLTDLGTLGGDNSEADWINDAGQLVGRADLPDGTHHAVVWHRGKTIDLGTIDGDPCSNGHFINASGQAIGTTTDCQGTILHTFLWEKGKMIDLSSQVLPGSGFVAVDPAAINDAGEIVGNGTLLNGESHVVVLRPCNDGDAKIASNYDSASITSRVAAHPTEIRELMPKSPVDRMRAKIGQRYRVPGTSSLPTRNR